MTTEGLGVAAEFRDAWSAGDRERARLLLHPYLHWTGADGVTRRGRTVVLASLPPGELAEPRSAELRDGQIYRWQAHPSQEDRPAAPSPGSAADDA